MDDLSDLKAFALSVAAEVLPREIERLSAGELATLQSLCSEDEQTMLVDALASSFVTFLLVPPGDATSKLSAALPEPEKFGLAELYWRCIVAVALMPEASLENLARHHPDLQKGHLCRGGDGETASTVPRRRLLVEAILPRFAMTCTTREDAEAAERRKKEMAEMTAAAAAEEAAEAAAEEAAAAASSKSIATTGSTALSTPEDAGPTEDGVLL